MKDFKISLAGDLGSGKSTVGEILAKKYNLEKVSIGKIQREMATNMSMTTMQFNQYMESHPELDNILDNKLREYESKKGNFLFDSRMAWHFVPSSFKVYMVIDTHTAAERVFNANRQDETYSSIEEAVKCLTLRRESEKVRYKSLYNVDILDMNNYDIVVVVDGKTPNEVAEEIINKFEIWLNK